MSVKNKKDFEGIKEAGYAAGSILRAMIENAEPGMTTSQLDSFGATLMKSYGASSAPMHEYGFPGYTCISLNHEFCHGIPSQNKVIQEGDLLNIDVSIELKGYYADNGASIVVGEDIHGHQNLINASKKALQKAIETSHHRVKISEVGRVIENESKKFGFRVIRNLAGHGVGRSLHEKPTEILNYKDVFNKSRFRKYDVVAIETFIANKSNLAVTGSDGWTLIGNKGGYMAQHEHTLMITDEAPVILTEENGILS